jgi:3-hydroxyisobutyrate dehydrogenase-like beta-hydroxyacid dehydrogenase
LAASDKIVGAIGLGIMSSAFDSNLLSRDHNVQALNIEEIHTKRDQEASG